ncbi:MAG TPA: hypothetical protein VMV72_12310 [Verrucomicrobiae bacterium]|nr:hypothetical protein [Verrucomicrobiae bacterium]
MHDLLVLLTLGAGSSRRLPVGLFSTSWVELLIPNAAIAVLFVNTPIGKRRHTPGASLGDRVTPCLDIQWFGQVGIHRLDGFQQLADRHSGLRVARRKNTHERRDINNGADACQ